jgi:hypothetical protein
MKIVDFIDILEVQTILNGLAEDFDALKTTLRAQVDVLTLRDVRKVRHSSHTLPRTGPSPQYWPLHLPGPSL